MAGKKLCPVGNFPLMHWKIAKNIGALKRPNMIMITQFLAEVNRYLSIFNDFYGLNKLLFVHLCNIPS